MSQKNNYTKLVFNHPINYTFMTEVMLAFVSGNTVAGVFGAIVEALSMWMVPDLKSVQLSIDNSERVRSIERQRWYYLKTLWNVAQPGGMWFSSNTKSWTWYVNRSDGPNGAQFEKLCTVVKEMTELMKAGQTTITNDQILRVEEMINGYLSLLAVVKATSSGLSQINVSALSDDFEKLQRTAKTLDPRDKAGRIIVGERLKSIKSMVDSIPRLKRRKEFAEAQASNIAGYVEAMGMQVRTSGALGIESTVSDVLFETPEVTVDELEIAAEIRGITSSADADVDNPEMWEDLASKLSFSPSDSQEPVAVKTLPDMRKRSRSVVGD